MILFEDIRDAIAAKIDNNKHRIARVYRNNRPKLEKFPAAVVTPTESEGENEDSANDRMTFVFKVLLYYPVRKEEDYDLAEPALGKALDEVLTMFLPRDALLPTCEFIRPTMGVWGWEERADGIYRIATVTIKCEKIVRV